MTKPKHIKFIFFTLFLLLISISSGPSAAQQIVVNPLFEYPQAPDEIENLQERSDYLMRHFWEPMNLKSKTAVDQAALNHAMGMYTVAMQFADKEVAVKSVDDLLKKLEKNPVLLLQFTKAAEENIYGERAKMWIDEIYIKFLQALVKNKKIDSLRKTRYQDQLRILSGSAIGAKAPRFNFTGRDGTKHKYFPMSTFTIIEFGDPDCIDCRMAKLKLDTDLEISRLVEEGKLNILFIIPDAEEESFEFIDSVADYPKDWTVGASSEVDDIYDLRLTPAFYVINGKGEIIAKNIGVENVISLTLDTLK